MREVVKCPRCKKQIAWKINDTGNEYEDYIACNPDGSGDFEIDENESYCIKCHKLYCSNCRTELERKHDDYRYHADLLDFKCDKCLKREGIYLDFSGTLHVTTKRMIKHK